MWPGCWVFSTNGFSTPLASTAGGSSKVRGLFTIFLIFFFSLLAICGCQTRGWRRKELNEIIVHCSALTLVGLQQCLGLVQGWDFHCSSTPACPAELNLEELCPQSTPGYFLLSAAQTGSNWDWMFSGQSRSDPFFSCSLKEGNENTFFSRGLAQNVLQKIMRGLSNPECCV